eukprot:1858866-Amphidinium_carterae.2
MAQKSLLEFGSLIRKQTRQRRDVEPHAMNRTVEKLKLSRKKKKKKSAGATSLQAQSENALWHGRQS